MVELILKKITHAIPVFRFYAMDILAGLVLKTDTNAIKELKNLLNNPNWRIRYWATINLKDLNQLDPSYQLSLLDKIKSYFLNSLEFD